MFFSHNKTYQLTTFVCLWYSIPEIVFWHIPSIAYSAIGPQPLQPIVAPCVGNINYEAVAPQEAEWGIMNSLASRSSIKVWVTYTLHVLPVYLQNLYRTLACLIKAYTLVYCKNLIMTEYCFFYSSKLWHLNLVSANITLNTTYFMWKWMKPQSLPHRCVMNHCSIKYGFFNMNVCHNWWKVNLIMLCLLSQQKKPQNLNIAHPLDAHYPIAFWFDLPVQIQIRIWIW
jgi:hypothetical protein